MFPLLLGCLNKTSSIALEILALVKAKQCQALLATSDTIKITAKIKQENLTTPIKSILCEYSFWVGDIHTFLALLTTYWFLAGHPKRPRGAPWPETQIGNGPCESPSGTSVLQPLRSQHLSTGLWSDHLQSSREREPNMVTPFGRLPGLFSPQALVLLLATTIIAASHNAIPVTTNSGTVVLLLQRVRNRSSCIQVGLWSGRE